MSQTHFHSAVRKLLFAALMCNNSRHWGGVDAIRLEPAVFAMAPTHER